MKRLGILFVVVVALILVTQHNENDKGIFCYADTLNLKIGTLTFTDTIVAGDSARQIVQIWTEKHEGFYNLQYTVRAIANNVKVKLYIEESADPDQGYFNRTLIDSIVAAESTLIVFDSYMHGNRWIRAVADGFGSAGDSSFVQWIFEPVPR